MVSEEKDDSELPLKPVELTVPLHVSEFEKDRTDTTKLP
eukprot:CAMPEP_0117426726 /NCGR_PEP_ID=MMETSP0758-20121206/6761_1 /TAXON_ID=63605 /ORGANISM="Percolomonas cosmopolitus, Strain AE-1 (ATCC 50343)" /LENGTH=38 /DNA_ID= /DNA_START= /DNA_END= /DNA_ORIENTATION=